MHDPYFYLLDDYGVRTPTLELLLLIYQIFPVESVAISLNELKLLLESSMTLPVTPKFPAPIVTNSILVLELKFGPPTLHSVPLTPAVNLPNPI